MRHLDMLERKKEDNIDAISGLTGEMLGEIFAWKDDIWQRSFTVWDSIWGNLSI